MTPVIGNELLFDAASVGAIYNGQYYKLEDDTTILSFVAESDSGGATSPCFVANLPETFGYMVRGSATSVSGFAPTATSTLTFTDQFGATAGYAVTTAGSSDFRTDSTAMYLIGSLKLSIDTMGAASKRWRITLVLRPHYNRV